MADIVWLDQAKDDLREILQFIAGENPGAAKKHVEGISESCRRLADFPLSGRQCDADYRSIVFRNHLVF